MRRGPVAPGLRALALAAALAACGDASPASEATVRDSTGIEIVENPAAAAESPAGWRVASEPSLAIGVVEGEESYQLFRVNGATRLADGRFAVLNGGTGEVRVFDAGGRFLGAVGGVGDGPGEFRDMALVASVGDSLLVYDRRAPRFTWVTARPAVGRSFPASQPSGERLTVSPRGRLESGAIVASGGSIAQEDGLPSTGVRDPIRHLLFLSADGVVTDTVGAFSDDPKHLWIGENMSFVSIASVPFGTVTRIAVGGNAIHVATAEAWEIRSYTPDGRLARIARLARDRRPLSPEVREAWIDEQLGGEDETGVKRRRRQYELMEVPELMPAYGRVILDRASNLWVEEYRAPGDSGPPRWFVFDTEGRARGVVPFPEGLDVLEIGADYVLGVARDELDTERVVVYELERGPASASG